MQLDSIRIAANVISVESIAGGGGFQQALSRIPLFLSNVRTMLQTQLSTAITTVQNFAPGATPPASQLDRLKNYDWSTLRNRSVEIPEGLKVPMVEYTEQLLAAAALQKDIFAKMSNPMMKWINHGLSNPSALSAFSSNIATHGYTSLPVEQISNNISACFANQGQLQSFAKYGSVIRRQSEWESIQDHVRQIHTLLTPAGHKQLVKSLQELEISFDTLQQRLVSKPEKYQMSQTTVMDLVKHVVAVAEAFDFYAQLCYRVQELEHKLVKIADACAYK